MDTPVSGNTAFIQVILPLRLEWEPYYALPEGFAAHPGDRVHVTFAHKGYIGVVSAVDVEPQAARERILPIGGIAEGLPTVRKEEIQLWRAVAAYYLCTVGEVYKAAYPARRVDEEAVEARVRERLLVRMAKLEEKLAKARKDETRNRYRAALDALRSGKGPDPGAGQEIHLTLPQETAVREIRQAFAAGKTALLHGVTGSGKTEIYLSLAKETLAAGRNVLYLVPEIALSRQLEDRISTVFPGLQVFHSAETVARRQQVAARVRQDGPCLILGTRSALFLPHHDLGLIIVDEEHDTSYKQDSPAPRYNGRDTAIMLGVIQGAPVLLGSATPSLESLYNAENGRFVKVDLKQRFHESADPGILLVDTIAEQRKRGMVGNLSRKLLAEIERTLEAGGQVLVLRGRRAYAPTVQCTGCGTIQKCPRCNVPLSLHRNPDRLVCHYCGHSEAYTGLCSQCGSPLQPLGAGTQKIEEELQALFPQARLSRLDSDTPETQEADIIRSFAEGNIDILVGTQIVTKGFDFKGLTLVAVIQADSLVGLQDFRADERALQLLEQFRGRAGRRGRPGLLVIQTRAPEHPVYARLSGQPDGRLLQERRLFGYPPYTRIVQLVLRDESPDRIESMGHGLVHDLSAALPDGPTIIGPYPPAVDRVSGRHIRHIRIMLPRDKSLLGRKQTLATTVSIFEKNRHYTGHITIDVDPV